MHQTHIHWQSYTVIVLWSFDMQNWFVCSTIINWIAYANVANIVNKDSPLAKCLSTINKIYISTKSEGLPFQHLSLICKLRTSKLNILKLKFIKLRQSVLSSLSRTRILTLEYFCRYTNIEKIKMLYFLATIKCPALFF